MDSDKKSPIEVTDWDGLVQYTQFLCRDANSTTRICVIDDENEEICVQTKDEFDLNTKYAKDHGMKSVTLVVYIDDKHVFDGIYYIEKPSDRLSFPVDKLKLLEEKVLAEKWYIPVKIDEALGVCLTAAIKILEEGKLDEHTDCQRFIETIVPDAFYKLQTAKSVLSWPREVQYGIFELIELFIDLIGVRLRYPPVPVTLLNTLALIFDMSTTFCQKHKSEPLPTRRTYVLKDTAFLRENLTNDTFGWLRSIMQRFVALNGLQSIRLQFEYINSSNSSAAAKEYNALLRVFSKCDLCINAQRFHLIFVRPVRQAIQYLQKQTPSDELKILYETLAEICYKYDLRDETFKLHSLPYHTPVDEHSSILSDSCSETTPFIETSEPKQRKSKHKDCYEILAENVRIMTMDNNDPGQQNVKKQRTNERISLNSKPITDCIDNILTSSEKRSLKRKHHRSTVTSSNSGHISKKEIKRSNTITLPSSATYDRTNPADILRYFGPMKLKIAALYESLQIATAHGHLREVLKIQEKLKLLRPFSAQFIADENTPDGTKMKPGQIFRKGWILFNDGNMPWDNNDIQLINLTDGIRILQQPVIPVTAPHSRAVITVDYMCSTEPGTYESKWILAYRQQTFGPIIWCSIEVTPWSITENECQSITSRSSLNEFEYVEVPLPECFDLSKPFQSSMRTSTYSSIQSNPELNRIDSTELLSTFLNTFEIDDTSNLHHSDTDSNSTSTPSTPVIVPQKRDLLLSTASSSLETSTKLIETVSPTSENSTTPTPIDPASNMNHDDKESVLLNPPLDFVESVLTNFCTAAKQAGSTAKAIFHSLQAYDESAQQSTTPTLVNTYEESEATSHALSSQTTETSMNKKPVSSNDPMKTLIEMGFANRAKNQRLLRQNANDLAKVIELLTLENNDADWFNYRH